MAVRKEIKAVQAVVVDPGAEIHGTKGSGIVTPATGPFKPIRVLVEVGPGLGQQVAVEVSVRLPPGAMSCPCPVDQKARVRGLTAARGSLAFGYLNERSMFGGDAR